MEKILHRQSLKIYCVHCKQIVESVWICKMDSVIGIRYAVLCDCCYRLVGIYPSTELETKLNSSQIIFDDVQMILN